MSKELFESAVLAGLKNCGIIPELVKEKKEAVGVAVSGGADSVSLLISLCNILKPYCISVKVISVNHFMRPDEETCGDAEFVKTLCINLKKKGFEVSFNLKELKKGQVQELAVRECIGLEAAARKLRYSAFEAFAAENHLEYVCLAHNKNDQEETVLMRFLQGSGFEGQCGIPQKRGIFCRPLLNINRKQIEAYLTEQDYFWRTDKTNFETEYLRNRIRHVLVPLLNREFPFWEKTVLNNIKDNMEDAAFISTEADKIKIKLIAGSREDSTFSNEAGNVKGLAEKTAGNEFEDVTAAEINADEFLQAPAPIQRRVLFKAINSVSDEERISGKFIEDVLQCCKNSTDNIIEDTEKNYGAGNRKKSFTKKYSDIEITFKENRLLIKKCQKKHTDMVFFDIIKESGVYEFPFGTTEVIQNNDGTISLFFNSSLIPEAFKLPLCIRNYRIGDVVKTSDGKMKKIIDVFSDWKVPEEKRSYIPLIQELETGEQKIICILGGFLGFKNWIEQNKSIVNKFEEI